MAEMSIQTVLIKFIVSRAIAFNGIKCRNWQVRMELSESWAWEDKARGRFRGELSSAESPALPGGGENEHV